MSSFNLYGSGPRHLYQKRSAISPDVPLKNKIAKNVLITLALGAGGALLTASAGGALCLMAQGVVILALNRERGEREIRRLKKTGYVALTKTPEGFMIRLLKKADRRLKSIMFEDLTLPRPAKWDGKWRLFIFDIPEKSRLARDLLRRKLKDLGMYNIQRSVFAYPYDCRTELDFLGKHYGIERFTTYAEVSYSDLDKELRKFFHLKHFSI